uniref:Uncharacterized protein n=1 Tax=Cajanus cajan TaxID=3821 RepID=A0A151R4C9_CAJCA|nr:hypothetical protein KK1_041364 [Cajanus cajan]
MRATGKLERSNGAYNVVVRMLSRRQDWEGAERLISEMKATLGSDMSFHVFNTLIYACCKRNLVQLATKWFRMMLECHVAPNVATFGMLMALYRKASNLQEAEFALSQMRRFRIVCPSAYSSMVTIYTRLRLFQNAERVIEFMRRDHVAPNFETWLVVLNAYCQQGKLEEAERVLEEMREAGFCADIVAYNTMITGYGKASRMDAAQSVMGRFKDAEVLYLKLKSSGIALDMIAFSIVVRMYVKAGSLKDACTVLDDVDKRPDIVPDKFLLCDMLRIYQRCNMVDKLADLYYKISKTRVNWDQELYNCVLNCCAQALPVDELSRLFDDMVQRGFLPSTITFNVMLDVFGKAKLFKKVWRLYCMAKKQGLVDVITYNTIIAAYGKNKDFENMSSTVQKMEFDGFSVSLEAYNSMLDAYGKDGQMDTFRSVLQKMRDSNCASDHYTYNTMINIYGEQGWIDEVASVLTELKECGLRPDLCSYNTLIKAYGIAGMVEEAVALIKEMRKNGIEPDKKTYTNLVTALRRNDKFLEAVKWSLWMKQMKL